jgi:FkbM family methyltransferase
MKYQIKYGKDDVTTDITEVCFSKYAIEGIIYIPENDILRGTMFPDPLYGIVKSIYIYDLEYDISKPVVVCDSKTYVIIDTQNNTIYENKTPEYLKDIVQEPYIKEKLKKIHDKLVIKHGDFTIEIPEQMMAMRFLTGDEKILEIGGNIGRNSLLLAHILKQKNNQQMVTLESHPYIAEQLKENRNLNGFTFFVEASALSKRKLIQGLRTWNTFESDEVLDGFIHVNTITWEELQVKYNIDFDTLVLDCEGAFYNILKDMPEILDNIKKILVENDYGDISHKKFVDDMLIERNFKLKYNESLKEEVQKYLPCKNDFYQYWQRKD